MAVAKNGSHITGNVRYTNIFSYHMFTTQRTVKIHSDIICPFAMELPYRTLKEQCPYKEIYMPSSVKEWKKIANAEVANLALTM